MNSREKGKRGERELASVLRDLGYMTRRGQQFSGANGDADVVGIEGLHIECKRVERGLNLEKALEQSRRDAREEELPCVMHRRNGERWKVTMYMEDWDAVWKVYSEVKNEC